LRARANIPGSNDPASFLSPRPRPSSMHRRLTSAGCWWGSDCSESRWALCGQSFRTTLKLSSARAGRLAGRATSHQLGLINRRRGEWPRTANAREQGASSESEDREFDPGASRSRTL